MSLIDHPGLPNEIDFVFNTIMLLSSDEYHGFRIYSSPRLIDLMLAHIGYFGVKSTHNYCDLYENVWHSNKGRVNVDNDVDDDEAEGGEFKFGNTVPECGKFRQKNYVEFWSNAVQLPEDVNRDLILQLLPTHRLQYNIGSR